MSAKPHLDPTADYEKGNPYVIPYSFMEHYEQSLEHYCPKPEELAAMASRLFGGLLLWHGRNPQKSGTTNEGTFPLPPVAEIGKQAVWAALAIVQEIRDGSTLINKLNRQLTKLGDEYQEQQQKKLDEFIKAEWPKFTAAQRRKHAVPTSTHIEKVDLDVYLKVAMPNSKESGEARQAKFLAFRRDVLTKRVQSHVERYQDELAAYERHDKMVAEENRKDPGKNHVNTLPKPVLHPRWQVPSEEQLRDYYSEGVSLQEAFDWSESFPEFLKSWRSQALKAAGSKGGKARHAKRKARKGQSKQKPVIQRLGKTNRLA